MSKRGANNYLTHDNWDQDDDEVEEAGVFRNAGEKELQKRTILKARRRRQDDSEITTTEGNKSTFAGFSFGSTSTETSKDFKIPSFNFSSKTEESKMIQEKPDSKTNGSCHKDSSPLVKDDQLKDKSPLVASNNGKDKVDVEEKKDEDPDDAYTRQMKQLNESFCKWINECIAKNPMCILTPCLEDYNNYVEKLDKEYPSVVTAPQTSQKSSSAPFSFAPSVRKESENKSVEKPEEPKKTPMSSFTFGASDTNRVPAFGVLTNKSTSSASPTNQESSITKKEEPTGTGFSFFGNKIESSTTTAPTFSFSTGTTGFSFGTGSSFGRGLLSKPLESKTSEGGSDQTGAAGGDDEDYEPPKAEVVENAEDDAFHTVRCKLYYKKNDKFEERGVGFLYLKPNGEKTQLLVRTDTALGNILLNINIDKVMPVSRQGKNNVVVICVPNPQIDPKADSKIPVPMLIRVKGEDDADKLYKEITDCQAKM